MMGLKNNSCLKHISCHKLWNILLTMSLQRHVQEAHDKIVYPTPLHSQTILPDTTPCS